MNIDKAIEIAKSKGFDLQYDYRDECYWLYDRSGMAVMNYATVTLQLIQHYDTWRAELNKMSRND